MRIRVRWQLAIAAGLLAASIGGSAAGAGGATSPKPRPGGTLDVLVVGAQWSSLDPATNEDDPADVDYQNAEANFQNAIYGQLFELAPNNAIVDDEATGYRFFNHNATVDIYIRPGLKFANGDAFTAANVAWNINRDLTPAYGNVSDVNFPVKGAVTTRGRYTVVMNLTQPDTAIIHAFIDEAPNWTVDEAALNEMEESQYAIDPVGAGPFEVQSDLPSNQLDLVRNPNYWNTGRPYLDGLDFIASASDTSAVANLTSGADQMALNVTTIPLLQKLPSMGFEVTHLPKTVDEFIALNTREAPFNNVLAREAVSYATDPKALVTDLYGDEFTPVEAETGPGQEYYLKTDPYYRAYNLKKAKALVAKLGGLTVSLATTDNTPSWTAEVQKIATMWLAAGIQVNVEDYSLAQMLTLTYSNGWQAIDENWGPNVDPSIDLPQFFSSHSTYSGVDDSKLDGMFNQAEGFVNQQSRARVFQEIANYENEHADAVWLYAKNIFYVSTKSVVANGGFSGSLLVPRWEEISLVQKQARS